MEPQQQLLETLNAGYDSVQVTRPRLPFEYALVYGER